MGLFGNGNPVMELAKGLASGRVKVVDLSVPLGPDTPVIELPPPFTNTPKVQTEVLSKYDEHGPAWYWSKLVLGEHTGTHFDAPVHWVTGKDFGNGSTDTIEPERFVGPACVIDVSKEVAKDANFLLEPDHIKAFEAKHGRIPSGAWVLMRTDWSKRTDPAAFLNVLGDGPNVPGPSVAAVRFLVDERDVLGFGVETVGTDAGKAHSFDPPFPCHTMMQGHNRFGLASLANLDKLPPTGAVVIAAPLKIVNGSGSPIRALALVAS